LIAKAFRLALSCRQETSLNVPGFSSTIKLDTRYGIPEDGRQTGFSFHQKIKEAL
jgi:hypothetical protein